MTADNPRVFVPPPLMMAGLVGAGLAIDGAPIASGIVLVAALVVGLAGLGLIAAALGLFRQKQTRPEPWREASFLVAAGPYRFTRNPMYLGMTLIGLAVAIGLTSLAAALFALLGALIIDRFVIAREEAYLIRRFGDDYRGYRARVRRWL
ncbi:isoprenylcysteine carboxylmethyltransferase family protein [Sphingomonas sabuli]|uniref:Isoprenylcysteine carboxylmethyltransferase family protein n=1 Tax=Sphingomonas sabuli TaxID=2764186 RepID=A0A7G9L3Y2_9SPHN|nr:isoprenylcysteine carboxylmethyltransferase family protein [Sphingomonas sabuli]QNM83331.1 isoprenylcysteine carboxylmethyltransferase family protein [Sphingomonas sabuli]